jgi:hypothetical protein
VRQVDESPTFPTSGLVALQTFARYLQPLFNAIGFRVNRCLPKDGSERPTAPLPLAVYTTATLPPASAWPGTIVFVSDAAGGHQLQGSDGTSWVFLS